LQQSVCAASACPGGPTSRPLVAGRPVRRRALFRRPTITASTIMQPAKTRMTRPRAGGSPPRCLVSSPLATSPHCRLTP
jgi:hypothetical protein